MLTHEVFIHQKAVDVIQLWVNTARNPRHFRHFFHHHRVMHRIVGIFPLDERSVLIHHNSRRMQRLGVTQRFDNHFAGIQFVLTLHLFFA